ncbi:hypothetical protein [uncultured Bradyrhizobium sp.]|uniref:hypothetical protein n=1 Tax=uncultured Bradyrhizobium sp. TaxID=199684 RepID=UPI0035CBC861
MASQVTACMLARIELALEQARDCIKGETPEDITPGEAEDDTFSKIREALEDVAALRRLAAKPTDEGVREPTEAMLNAARDWAVVEYGRGIGNDAARGCWQAMFDAAPLPSPDGKVAAKRADGGTQ